MGESGSTDLDLSNRRNPDLTRLSMLRLGNSAQFFAIARDKVDSHTPLAPFSRALDRISCRNASWVRLRALTPRICAFVSLVSKQTGSR